MPLNYDALNALTKKKYIPKLVDNFFLSNPLLNFLKDRASSYGSGTAIVQPLIYAGLGNITSYSGYDTITYDTSIPITAAEFTPKNIVAPLIISLDEERTNSGEQQVMDLLDAKFKILQQTLNKTFTTQLYADGTGNSGKDITGLGAMFSATGTYGGIDRATYAWWRPIIKANAGTNRNLTEGLLLDAFLAASDGDDTPEVIFTDQDGWTQYYALVKGRIQIYTETVKKSMALGFQTLEFMGKPVIMDKNLPKSGTGSQFMFLNMKYLNFKYHPQANFTTTKWRPDDTRLAKKQEIIWTGNLTCSNLSRQAVLRDIAPTGLSV